MTKKRKAVLAAVIAIAVVFASIGGVLIWDMQSSQSYERQISLAKNYFDLGNYEKAISVYQYAVQLAPERVEGYEGLVRVYSAQGNIVMADSVMKLSLAKTGSTKAQDVFAALNAGYAGGPDAVPAVGQDSPVEINISLLRTLRSSTFNDYRVRNGIESTVINEDGTCTVRAAGMAADLVFSVTDVDRLNGKPLSDRVPRKAFLDDATALFGGRSGFTLERLKMAGASRAQVISDKVYDYILVFEAEGCEITIEADADGLVSPGAWCQIIIPEAAAPAESSETSEDEEPVSCLVSGRVISAVTGDGVSGARLDFRPGANKSGEPAATASTDGHGWYEATLESGAYTVEVTKDGYEGEYFELAVPRAEQMVASSFVISPILEEGQIRIVLEWGEYPRDLDSYLEGELDTGEYINTSYLSPVCSSNSGVLAELDVDDRDGFGPETTTIYNINGVFSFHVEDFTETGEMSSSGATVKIYTPRRSSPVIVNICSGLNNYWSVCTIDHGEVTVTNHS